MCLKYSYNLYSRNVVQNIESTNLLHYFSFNGGLLNFLLTSWINGIKSSTNHEIFRDEILLEDVSFVINSMMKSVSSR